MGIFANFLLLYLDLKSRKEGQDLWLRKLRSFELVLCGIDVVIGGSREVRLGKIGVLKPAGKEIRTGEVRPREVRIHEIAFLDSTLHKLTLPDIKFIEITELQYTMSKLPTQEERVDRRKYNTDEFAVLKRDFLETTIHNFNIGEIAIYESTIRKMGERKITLTEIAFLECAMQKILITQVS